MNNVNIHLRSSKSTWAMLIYFIGCFYIFGVFIMLHFVNYPAFGSIHENFAPTMQIFNQRLLQVCYIPAGLLVIAAFGLLKFCNGIFPRWAILSSVFLSILSFAALLFIIMPMHSALAVTGFTEAVQHKLMLVSMYLQIIPCLIQVVIALWLLNLLLKGSSLFGRWLFICVFAFIFYSGGTYYMETYINYKMWSAIGNTDWVAFRHSLKKSILLYFFLIPAYLPVLLLIPMFWKRPKGIPKLLVSLFLLAELFVFIVSAVYFVPKIQIPLSMHGYSLPLIKDLLSNEFLLRGVAIISMFIVAGRMFIKAEQ